MGGQPDQRRTAGLLLGHYRDLPIASSFDDIWRVCRENEELREKLNRLIGGRWASTVKLSKRDLREFLLSNPTALQALVAAYRKAEAKQYDFEHDPSGEVIWRAAAEACVRDHPLALSLPVAPTIFDVREVVGRICDQYTRLIEDHSWWRLLYKENGKPKHESAAQLLFFGCAEAYCNANNLDLTRESNGGRGAVDFKLSRGADEKVLVEVKLSTNKQLVHGYSKQLPDYMRSEMAHHSVYLVIQVAESHGLISSLRASERRYEASGARGPAIILVNGLPKSSASRP